MPKDSHCSTTPYHYRPRAGTLTGLDLKPSGITLGGNAAADSERSYASVRETARGCQMGSSTRLWTLPKR